jgi:hypothetical protein
MVFPDHTPGAKVLGRAVRMFHLTPELAQDRMHFAPTAGNRAPVGVCVCV